MVPVKGPSISQHFVVFYILTAPAVSTKEHYVSKRAADLRSLRLQKRLTQEEVAQKFKVSQSYYSAIERGQKPAEITSALQVVNGMRKRTDRTGGGASKAGREKT